VHRATVFSHCLLHPALAGPEPYSVARAGLEPATCCLWGSRATELLYLAICAIGDITVRRCALTREGACAGTHMEARLGALLGYGYERAI
jgi:hypothetical protein